MSNECTCSVWGFLRSIFMCTVYVRISLTNDELGHPPKSNRVVFLGEENNVNRIKSISKIFTSLSKLYVMFVLRRILKRIIISNYSAVYLNEGKWRLNHRKRLFALITEIRYLTLFCDILHKMQFSINLETFTSSLNQRKITSMWIDHVTNILTKCYIMTQCGFHAP